MCLFSDERRNHNHVRELMRKISNKKKKRTRITGRSRLRYLSWSNISYIFLPLIKLHITIVIMALSLLLYTSCFHNVHISFILIYYVMSSQFLHSDNTTWTSEQYLETNIIGVTVVNPGITYHPSFRSTK